MTYTDLLGHKLEIGDIVAYPTQSYSSATHMVVGRLEKITDYERGGKAVWRALVKPLSWSGHRWSAKKYNTETCQFEDVPGGPKPVTITKVQNLVKVVIT